MHPIIKNLQQKPVHVRENVALSVAFIAALFLFIAWATLLPYRLHKTTSDTAVKEQVKPFTLLKDNIVEVYANVSKGLESATKK